MIFQIFVRNSTTFTKKFKVSKLKNTDVLLYLYCNFNGGGGGKNGFLIDSCWLQNSYLEFFSP